jgi:hypothetical protein
MSSHVAMNVSRRAGGDPSPLKVSARYVGYRIVGCSQLNSGRSFRSHMVVRSMGIDDLTIVTI